METDWFKRRGYKHFDRQVGESFATKAMDGQFVAEHAFSPLIHHFRKTKSYKKPAGKTTTTGKTKTKNRPIKYASHRDACILSFYSKLLTDRLNDYYENNDLDEHVIAYRSLGKGNFDFSAEAYNFAKKNSPVTILAFDVSGFFDNLNHKLLKTRLKQILKADSLSKDWYSVFRFVTKFHYVEIEDLRKNAKFDAALKAKGSHPIATVSELKSAGINFYPNPTPGKGIPQGTPISASLSNLYLMDFDVAAEKYCASIGALYLRYSDDILVICPTGFASDAEKKISDLVASEELTLSADKTDRVLFDPSKISVTHPRCAQYLGFTYHEDGAAIRPASMSRQWRKMRRSLHRTRRIVEADIAAGGTPKIFTKKLRRRFTSLPMRNFSSYARRSAKSFGNGEKISRQIKRFERAFERELKALKNEFGL
jgi:hypothetical protein